MLRNKANQKFHVIAFDFNGRVSGDAANITATLAIDGGVRFPLNDIIPVEIGTTGEYVFDLLISETNGHELSFSPVTTTNGVQVLGSPSNVIYTELQAVYPGVGGSGPCCIQIDGCNLSCCIQVSEVTNFKINGCSVGNVLCNSAEEIQAQLCESFEYIEKITQTSWCPYDECKQFSGSGSYKLFFTPVTTDRLLSITSVNFNNCCDSSCKCEGTPTNYGTNVEYLCGEYFPCGRNNIQICGKWGEELPLNIRKAIILLTLERLQPGITGNEQNTGSVQSVTWSDFAITYDTGNTVEGLTEFAFINRLIMPFIPTGSQISISAIGDDCCGGNK